MTYRIVIKRSAFPLRQRWFFVVVAPNGETVAQSEMYVRRVDCIDEANRLALAHFDVTGHEFT